MGSDAKRSLRKSLMLSIGSVVAVLVLAEVGLWLFSPIPFSEEVEYVPDAHLAMRLAPGKRYALKNGGVCSVNAQGFRGTRDTPITASPGTTRVVALGGSSTFCYQNDDARTWCALLEDKLRAHFGREVEVVNAGVPGYSAFDSKINYMYRIRPLRPDVVLVYHTWNDLKCFRSIEAGEWPERMPWWPTWRRHLKSLARHSQIARRVRAFMNEVVYPRRRENQYGAADRATRIAPDGPAHAWERHNFEDLAALLALDGVAGVFATQAGLATQATIRDPEIRKVLYVEYAGLTFEELVTEWDAVSGIIRGVAADRGVCLADARARVPPTREYFVDHVHLTDLGNEAVAQAVFDGMVACPDVERAFR